MIQLRKLSDVLVAHYERQNPVTSVVQKEGAARNQLLRFLDESFPIKTRTSEGSSALYLRRLLEGPYFAGYVATTLLCDACQGPLFNSEYMHNGEKVCLNCPCCGKHYFVEPEVVQKVFFHEIDFEVVRDLLLATRTSDARTQGPMDLCETDNNGG